MSSISYTSLLKYMTCPKEWDLHYNQRLRPIGIGSALPFGNAIDAACQDILKGFNGQALKTFEEKFSSIRYNGEDVDVRTSPLIQWHQNDLDNDLLTEEDQTLIEQGYNPAWCSLYRKGEIMLSSFRTKIMPLIKRVIAIQPEVKLKNASGDTFIAKADLICEWEDGTIRVIDIKTSSSPYKEDVIATSTQLATYDYALADQYNLDCAGYIVMQKNIKKNKSKICSKCDYDGSGANHRTCPNKLLGKRCDGAWTVKLNNPEAYIQVIAGEIPTAFKQLTVNNMDAMNKGIKAEVFYQNLGNCIRPWGKCPYYEKCHNGSDEGLVKLSKDLK